MVNVICNIGLRGFYYFILNLSIILIAIATLFRAFRIIKEAKTASLISLILSIIAFVLSFWLTGVDNYRHKIIATSLCSIYLVFYTFLKNCNKNHEELNLLANKAWVAFIAISYTLVVNSLFSFTIHVS